MLLNQPMMMPEKNAWLPQLPEFLVMDLHAASCGIKDRLLNGVDTTGVPTCQVGGVQGGVPPPMPPC